MVERNPLGSKAGDWRSNKKEELTVASDEALNQLTKFERFILGRAERGFAKHSVNCQFYVVDDEGRGTCVHPDGGSACSIHICPKVRPKPKEAPE